MNKLLAISINSCWNFVNFRAGLLQALRAEGFEILALAPHDRHCERLLELGCRVVHLPLNGHGKSPLQDALLLAAYYRILRRERPAAFLGYTVKPNIYGSLAAHRLGIPVINNIAGLGSVFASGGWLKQLVLLLYRRALDRSSTVFFQNPDDRESFMAEGLVTADRALLLPGSGVDLDRFAPTPRTHFEEGDRTFLMVSRALWSKGVGTFAEAAAQVHARGRKFRFQLLGILGTGKDAVGQDAIDQWVARGDIEWLGAADDVRPFLAAADCVVLPTAYREGTPRALLEAAAMAKPLIGTNVAGCREVVRDGENGLLIQPLRPDLLAEAMLRIGELPAVELAAMGAASRRLAELRFDERMVVREYRHAIARATGEPITP